jgi:hypothetical protein
VKKENRFPDGIPAGTKTPYGWLWDDGGEPDMVAVYLAVSGQRVPELTFTEALIASARLVEQARRIGNTNLVSPVGVKGSSAAELIALRLNISKRQARNLMACVRTRVKEQKEAKSD